MPLTCLPSAASVPRAVPGTRAMPPRATCLLPVPAQVCHITRKQKANRDLFPMYLHTLTLGDSVQMALAGEEADVNAAASPVDVG